MTRKKTQVAEIDRGIYDITNEFTYSHKAESGLTEKIVREISEGKDEPGWMLEKRLKSLELFNQIPNPKWGPDLTPVDMQDIVTYVRPVTREQQSWDDLPEDIRMTFDRLGIPQAERETLAGVGAQYDSEEVYHSVQQELLDQGVIYTDFDTAVKEYPELVQKYFQQAIPPTLHRYAALHGAVWSGGSFVYVPEGVEVEMPLQSYYRLNAPGAGQFEHTMLVVEPRAKVHFIEGCSAPRYNVLNVHAGSVEIFVSEGGEIRFSTIENWSRNMWNLNTKRAIVEKNGKVIWVSGSFGSAVSMLYPTSVLRGEGAVSEYSGITFAGEGQYLDTGAQVIHGAPNTTSTIDAKSISAGTGTSIYRSLAYFAKSSKGSSQSADCTSLMLNRESRSDTIPVIDIRNGSVEVGHEASIGRLDDEVTFYLMSRGLDEKEARALLVRGFAEPVAKALPVEYAVEMNNLIDLELEGANG